MGETLTNGKKGIDQIDVSRKEIAAWRESRPNLWVHLEFALQLQLSAGVLWDSESRCNGSLLKP